MSKAGRWYRITVALMAVAASTGCGHADAPAEFPRTGPIIASKAMEVPGQVTLIKPDSLPAPNATPSVNNGPHMAREPDDVLPRVLPGFSVNLFASGLQNPRNLAVAPDGSVFVVCSGPHKIVVLKDSTGAGKSDSSSVYTDALNQPFGIAFHGKYLYVGNTDSVVRFPYTPGEIVPPSGPETVVPNLPANGYNNHWTRDVAFSADGKTMYVSVGSRSNVAEELPPRASVLSFDPDGKNYLVYASGLRNSVGLAINPVDGQLWGCINERDNLGDDLPPDYATSIKDGGFYGWPYAYIGPHADPTFGPRRPDMVAKAITPDVLIEAHGAAVSIAFSTSKMFPKPFQGGSFVSLHGSWNRSVRSGYKVIYIPFKGAHPVDGSYENFMTGLLDSTGNPWARPVGLAFAKDGALLVCDDGGGKIWRIAYSAK